MDDREELLDCPFCGEKAVIGEGADHAYVTCRNCACSTPVCNTVSQAIDIWNTRAVQNGTKEKKRETPYERMKKSILCLIGMTCSMCDTKSCSGSPTECSGIAEAKEAFAEPPRNCDIEETYSDACCKYLKTHSWVNQNVSSWGWENWYDFALWLFKRQEKKQ